MIFLTEDDVVDAVRKHLMTRGFSISQSRKTTEKGDDIIAFRNDGKEDFELHVEAKGATSNRKTSSCYGEPFDESQMLVHVAGAFYRAAKMSSKGGAKGAIALPDNKCHRKLIGDISHSLTELNITVIWVDEKKTVSICPAGAF